MGNPIAPAKGIAFAFPDICLTNVSGAAVPVPYPNIAQLADAKNTSKVANKELLVGGEYILLDTSTVTDSTGGEAADQRAAGLGFDVVARVPRQGAQHVVDTIDHRGD
ncbi:MAG: DUF4150 domain-containing protein, partial [Psychrosphaera sp.]|nr:DUF4150 domain-containing protein [Psychrosphaera sp.]